MHFSLISCEFSNRVVYLPYCVWYFTLNVRISGEVLTTELIDRGEKSDFFKSPKKITKNDVSSVQENSKNVANASTALDIELVIFLSTIFPEVVGTYLQRETLFFYNSI